MPLSTKPDLALSFAVRALRQERGLTREAMAHEAGLTCGTLARIELGQSSPSWGSVRRIAAALGLPLTGLASEVEAVEQTDAHKVRVEISERSARESEA
jgi:transcriptional regulator with XRE-family HTH domain